MTEKEASAEVAGAGASGNNIELDQQVDGMAQDGAEVVDALAAERQAFELQLAESRDKYLRLMADFENFKRRALKEQSELLKYPGEKIVIDMLEVLDNLELALSHSTAGQDSLKTGLEMVHKLFVEKLGRWEIRGESGLGSQFDPQKHAAISRVPGKEVGVIVGELKRPYFYKDKLIRYGEVVVATGDDAQA